MTCSAHLLYQTKLWQSPECVLHVQLPGNKTYTVKVSAMSVVAVL